MLQITDYMLHAACGRLCTALQPCSLQPCSASAGAGAGAGAAGARGRGRGRGGGGGGVAVAHRSITCPAGYSAARGSSVFSSS
jgi:hypothetical protein